MRGLNFAALLAIVGVAACYPPSAQESPEIAALSDQWEAALNGGDIDALVAMYAEDSRLLPPNAELGEGLEAVRAAFGEMIAAGLTVELETVEAVAGGDIGYRVGTFVLQTADGMEVDHGKFIEVWRQVDGEWKIANDIWNSDMPAAGAGTVMIATHEVTDAAKWLAAWQGPGSRHELFAQHGAPNVRVFQSPDNPNLTGLLIEVADMQALEAMLNSPEGVAAATEDGVKRSTLRFFAEVK
jgi:ketosteroid isomerase-like protein